MQRQIPIARILRRQRIQLLSEPIVSLCLGLIAKRGPAQPSQLADHTLTETETFNQVLSNRLFLPLALPLF